MSQPQAWRVLKKRIVYEDRWVQVVLVDVLLPDGTPYTYTTLKRVPGAAVVAVNEEGFWLIQREYRHPLGRVIYQLPGGLVDEGETPLETARRGLLEETGYVAARWSRLGVVEDNPGLIEGQTTLFLARDLRYHGPPRPERTETFDATWRSPTWIRERILAGEITDRVLLAAYAFLCPPPGTDLREKDEG